MVVVCRFFACINETAMTLHLQCNSIKLIPQKHLFDCVHEGSMTGRSHCSSVCGRCTVHHRRLLSIMINGKASFLMKHRYRRHDNVNAEMHTVFSRGHLEPELIASLFSDCLIGFH